VTKKQETGTASEAVKEPLSPAVTEAQEMVPMAETAIVLSRGLRATVIPVAQGLLERVKSRVADPPIPRVQIEGTDREEENPNDPDYLDACRKVMGERLEAMSDAVLMFGLELEDPVPSDNGWVERLAMLGIEFDSTDPLEREFAYKKFVATTANDMKLLMARSGGLSEQEVRRAAELFRRAPKR
jgi:hypothetical protein